MKRKTSLVIIMILLMAGCDGYDADKRSGKNIWMSFNEGIELAGNLGKPVVIDFYTSWCKWCKVMDRETFSDPMVDAYLADNFVCIRVNAEKRSGKLEYAGKTYTPMSLARAFNIRGYPSLAYIDDEGGLIMVDPGFKKPKEFMTVLRYAKSGCHKKDVSLKQYKRNGNNCN
jgi:thioredoxin-related protein